MSSWAGIPVTGHVGMPVDRLCSKCLPFGLTFNTHMKTCAPLPACRINNALIQFVLSCRDTRQRP